MESCFVARVVYYAIFPNPLFPWSDSVEWALFVNGFCLIDEIMCRTSVDWNKGKAYQTRERQLNRVTWRSRYTDCIPARVPDLTCTERISKRVSFLFSSSRYRWTMPPVPWATNVLETIFLIDLEGWKFFTGRFSTLDRKSIRNNPKARVIYLAGIALLHERQDCTSSDC